MDSEEINKNGEVLVNKQQHITKRFRALFSLRNQICVESEKWIIKVLKDGTSNLLAHEAAYCLGQMQSCESIEMLIEIVDDPRYPDIVRHESAEALGAIFEDTNHQLTQKYKELAVKTLTEKVHDACKEVGETCELALIKIQNPGKKVLKNDLVNQEFNSIDPADPFEGLSEAQTIKIFSDNNSNISDRYRAMFSLRNFNTDSSAAALAAGLVSGTPLFRHEIGFVLGQMRNEKTIPALMDAVRDTNQHEMTRHECAMALGSFDNKDCVDFLKKYAADENLLVRESCMVALDMGEYEISGDFQYAQV